VELAADDEAEDELDELIPARLVDEAVADPWEVAAVGLMDDSSRDGISSELDVLEEFDEEEKVDDEDDDDEEDMDDEVEDRVGELLTDAFCDLEFDGKTNEYEVDDVITGGSCGGKEEDEDLLWLSTAG
jgi:hypothetical protein